MTYASVNPNIFGIHEIRENVLLLHAGQCYSQHSKFLYDYTGRGIG
jgi:hypothetical protein